MSEKKNKGGCPPKNRDCKMKRVMVQEPLVKTVKQMVKEYDNTGVIPEPKLLSCNYCGSLDIRQD
jgi:hypothetical protein